MTKSDPGLYNIGLKFRTLREKAGLSRAMIADIAGKSVRTIYRWENGESKPPKLVINELQRRIEMVNPDDSLTDHQKSFTFIDLFAGIGGFRIAFESIGGRCVFTSEWDKYARETYAANFSMDESHPFEGDITKVDIDSIPSHDVLLAGFPCQPFSIAGVSKKNALGKPHGFRDETQGTLFFNIKEILSRHRPSAFLLENVKNLVNHDRGRTFRVIRRILEDDLGYFISWRVINAKGYLPQNRERIFIAGFRENAHFNLNDIEVPRDNEGPRLKSILHPENGTEKPEPPYTEGLQAKVADKYTLTPKLWRYLQDYSEKHRKKGNGFGYGLVGPEDAARTLSARYYKDGSEILIRQTRRRPRRLTPRECARLMGFDRPGQEPFIIPVSDTQAYRQFGNAVAVPVVEHIASVMHEAILDPIGYTSNRAVQLRLLDTHERTFTELPRSTGD